MSLNRLNFTKDWTSAEDFPTVQMDENQVRADQQLLFNEIKDYLNDTLIPGIESAIAVACQDLVVGQLTAGSVTKDKLSAAIIEVLSRAELGGGLDARINSVSSEKVSKTGDTMTGSLTIQNASYPDINLKNTRNGSATKIRNTAHRTQIMSQEDDSNYRVLTLYDKSATTNPANVLTIQQVEGGVEKVAYKVLHTGNLSDLGVARIETGSYVGTGTNGCSLAFKDVPKLVFVWGPGHSPLVWTTGMSKCTLAGGDTYDLDVSLSDKTLSWAYNQTGDSNRPYHSLNSEGNTYGYAAFF